MVLNRKAAHAMAVQVNRVNLDNLDALRQQLDAALKEIDRLKNVNRKLSERLNISESNIVQKATMFWKNRPVITLEEAAAVAGVGYWTAYRYAALEGFWEGDQRQNGQWMVYADQSIVRRPKKKREKKGVI
jgi:hypothetical protein